MARLDDALRRQHAGADRRVQSTPNGPIGAASAASGCRVAAPALDSSGNMFLLTGNGSFDDTSSTIPAPAPNNDFGESFLNLSPTTLAVKDFYTPSQNAAWTAADIDISSGGITVLPDGVGPAGHPNLAGRRRQGRPPVADRPQQHVALQFGAANTPCSIVLLPGAGDQYTHPTRDLRTGTATVYMGFDRGPLMAFKLARRPAACQRQRRHRPHRRLACRRPQSAETYGYPAATADDLGLGLERRRHRLGARQQCERHRQRQRRAGSGHPARLRRQQPRHEAVLERHVAARTGGNAAKFTAASGGQWPRLHRRREACSRSTAWRPDLAAPVSSRSMPKARRWRGTRHARRRRRAACLRRMLGVHQRLPCHARGAPRPPGVVVVPWKSGPATCS